MEERQLELSWKVALQTEGGAARPEIWYLSSGQILDVQIHSEDGSSRLMLSDDDFEDRRRADSDVEASLSKDRRW